MRKSVYTLLYLVLLCYHAQAFSHHSFAVHFVPEKIISVSGEVTEYKFTNPHGLVFFKSRNKDGELEEWRAETNSPSVLRRRGWSKTSIKAGDMITVEGFPARDGSNILRIHRVVFPDGHVLLGQRRDLTDLPDND